MRRVCSALTWSVKGIVGVEDCGKEAEGERTDAEGHVKARVSKTLEPLHRYRRHRAKRQGEFGNREQRQKGRTR